MDILHEEARGCFDFFWNEISIENKTYGLIRDNSKNDEEMKETCSIASVGFGLSAICIGVHMNYITFEQGYQRCLKTMKTLEKLPHLHGFFYHFMNMSSGEGKWGKEFSIIDTSILMMGALCVSEFFKKDIEIIFECLYQRIEWDFYLANKETFFMGYNINGGFGLWDMYAEQMMIYFLSCASPTHPVSPDLFYYIEKQKGNYKTKDFIYTPIGTLFPYQFSHGFIDFRNKQDKEGIDWFENSVQATYAARQYCMDHKDIKGFGELGWGLTACEGPQGYCGDYGTLPSSGGHIADGTIAPCGAIGSLVFTPEYSLLTMRNYHQNYPQLWGKYGFRDAFNIHLKQPWFCDFVIGIDKGISLLMISNYLDNFIWSLTSQNQYINHAFQLLNFQKKE